MRSKTRRNADGRIRVNVTEGEIVVQTQFGLPAFIGLNDLKGYAKFSVLLLGINQSANASHQRLAKRVAVCKSGCMRLIAAFLLKFFNWIYKPLYKCT